MKYPNTTFAGQKVSICNRYIELFRDEHNAHPLGITVRSLRAELDALMPEAYHSHRIVWLATKWRDVVNGNEYLGFPGLPLDAQLEATAKKDEIIPPKNTLKLYNAIAGEKQLWEFSGSSHNSLPIYSSQTWWGEVMRFVDNRRPRGYES